jgi:endonuclease YncB( thermonuclease family)
MPFTVISGTFRVVGKTPAGNPSGFEPDGDSVQFRPEDPALLERLPVLDQPVELTTIGSTQLRMEGIDALELHFAGSHQPRPLADQARDALTTTLGLAPITYREPGRTRVQPPAINDGQPGWIASRSLDVHGRPVAWVFTGAPPEPDGSEIFLDDALAAASVNHAQLVAGAAYPLFYDTLFASLRLVLTAAAVGAEQRKDGLWASDATLTGVDGSTVAALEQGGVIAPKLFRRLVEFHGDTGRDLSEFRSWLATEKPEQLVDLDDNANFTHLDNVIEVTGSQVRMTRPSHRLVVVSAKGRAAR